MKQLETSDLSSPTEKVFWKNKFKCSRKQIREERGILIKHTLYVRFILYYSK